MFIAILCVFAFLQAPGVMPTDSGSESRISAELKKGMSSSAALGHEVQLTVTTDVHNADGTLLMPRGAKLTGKVTFARKHNQDQPAALSFVVERAEWKKNSVLLSATIDRIESFGVFREDQACLPDLSRTGGTSCGAVHETAIPMPAECSLGKADQNSQGNAVLCKGHEVILNTRAVFILKNALLSSRTSAYPPQPEANAHPYFELPPEQLTGRIPELKSLRPAQNQQLLPMILSKAGARVDDFTRQVVDLSAHEEITQESLDETGRTKSTRQREYSYLVLLHRTDLSPSPEEYRVDAKGNRVAFGGVDQGYAVTSGFAFAYLYFMPGNQPSSIFRFLGNQALGARNTYVVAFAQRPGQGTNTNFVSLSGVAVPTWIQGIAWIDEENFQILRMRTDLLEPLALSQVPAPGHTGLDQQTTQVTFAETRLVGLPTPLWLPSEVDVHTVFNRLGFHNEHRYTHYERFYVSSRIVTP